MTKREARSQHASLFSFFPLEGKAAVAVPLGAAADVTAFHIAGGSHITAHIAAFHIAHGMEESIKPITEEQEEFKPIEVQTPPTKIQPNQEIIKELPSWNIEPPIEVKRGN